MIHDAISPVLDRLFDPLTLIVPAPEMALVLRLHHHGGLVCMFLDETSLAEVLTFGEVPGYARAMEGERSLSATRFRRIEPRYPNSHSTFNL